MIGIIKRPVKTKTLYKNTCISCNGENSLIITVYSKAFMLRIMPFAVGKEASVSCTKCEKVYSGTDIFTSKLTSKIEVLKSETDHPWFFYIGYVLIGGIILLAILNSELGFLPQE